MKSHWIWMVIGCGLPLLLIFFAPALGIDGNYGFFGFILLMFVCHLLMPHGSHGYHEQTPARGRNGKGEPDKSRSLSEIGNKNKGHGHH